MRHFFMMHVWLGASWAGPGGTAGAAKAVVEANTKARADANSVFFIVVS